MQAYVDGKRIQIRATRINKSDWVDSYGEPHWDWEFFDYRVKPQEEKPVRMTNRQLAEWVGKGNGEWSAVMLAGTHSDFGYIKGKEDTPVELDLLIRPWGSDDWVEPIVDIYNRDCKGE